MPATEMIARLFKELSPKLNMVANALAPCNGMLETQQTLGRGTKGTVTMEWYYDWEKAFAVKRPFGVSHAGSGS